MNLKMWRLQEEVEYDSKSEEAYLLTTYLWYKIINKGKFW
jgi:hypothetical protein